MKTLTQNFGFYFLFFTATGLFYYFNYDPLVYYAIFTGSLALLYLLEKIFPFEQDWNTQNTHLGQDIIYAVSTIVISPLAKVVSTYLLVLLPLKNLFTNNLISNLPFVLQILTGLIISGFLPYWYHRLSHTKSPLLWKIHAIHHSPEKVYWLNGFRLHPINAFLTTFLSLLPLKLVGFSENSILLISFINNYVAILNHANIDFKLGIFNYVFNMNEAHRWHHSNIENEGNSNYSSGALIIWDILLGTFYLPKRVQNTTRIGLFETSKKSFPSSFVKQLLLKSESTRL